MPHEHEGALNLAARDDLAGLLKLFKLYDAELYERWGTDLEKATEPDELNAQSRAVLRVALDSVVHFTLPIIEYDVQKAFDAGSSILEILEACVHIGGLEGGAHSIHDGLEALHLVIAEREKAGLPVPLSGDPLTPEQMVPEAPWPVPPVFPMHSPNPRYHNQVLLKYAPEVNAAVMAPLKTPKKALTRRMQELIVTACDVAIIWPAPLLDHHMHAAYETGATTQELLETVLFSAASVQGATETSLSAHVPGGFIAMHHGMTALERVISEREGVGIWCPKDRNSPRVGKAALTL